MLIIHTIALKIRVYIFNEYIYIYDAVTSISIGILLRTITDTLTPVRGRQTQNTTWNNYKNVTNVQNNILII